AYIGLKGISSGIPERAQDQNETETAGNSQISPPAPGSGGGLGHRVCTPSAVDAVTPGALTLLSERRDCSHETISSLTFSWVSNSRILAATSAGGASGTMDCFNCGMNFSRDN